jgi:hypothetical protein
MAAIPKQSLSRPLTDEESRELGLQMKGHIELWVQLTAPDYQYCAGCGDRFVGAPHRGGEAPRRKRQHDLYAWLCAPCAVATFDDCDPITEQKANDVADRLAPGAKPPEEDV